MRARLWPVFAVVLALLVPLEAMASRCYAFVDREAGIRFASLGPLHLAEAAAGEIRILYVGHSTYRIETPAGVSINTDYYGLNGPGGIPRVVTMNRAHETHYTDYPDPAIEHVLRGWNPVGDGPAVHQLEVEDVVIRNVTTDIRGFGGNMMDGNSIFVFEVADLCIAHLGHLHHPLSEEQYALLGRIDILMIPVDGTWTMAVPRMVELAQRLKSQIVLPMHYWGAASLQRFVAGMGDDFAVRVAEEPVLRISVETLPSEPTVVVLPRASFRGVD
ncbi:MAG: MBL fold metallo-hydrolase [Paracoccaceae bacterium]